MLKTYFHVILNDSDEKTTEAVTRIGKQGKWAWAAHATHKGKPRRRKGSAGVSV